MHTPSIGASGFFLSVRSSCDRCRGQKLKCSVPPGSSTCERCARAKLVCVFGRRTPSRRSRQGHSARENNSSDNAAAGGYGDHGAISPPSEPLIRQHTCLTPISNPPLTPARQFSPWANSQIQYLNDTTTTYMPIAEQHQEQIPNFPPDALSPISEQDLNHLIASTPTYNTRSWNAVQLPGQSGQDATCMTTDYNWTQHSFDAFEANLLDEDLKPHCRQELACDSSGSQSPAAGWLSPESSYTATSILAETLGASKLTAFKNVPISPLLTSQRLLVLISEMQDWLAKIQQSPWFGNGENTDNLDDYPVGAVLQFSQQLADCARCLLDTEDSSAANNGLDYFGFPTRSRQPFENHSPSSASKIPGPLSIADTPTILLLLSGYMTLVRIFNVSLCHFQQYLMRMPMPSRHTPRGTPTTTSSFFGATAGHIAVSCQKRGVGRRTLRLGELHYATEAAAAASTATNNASSIGGLQKMHLAVSMLLEEWQDVETYLGPEGRLARESVVALLVQDGQEGSKERGLMVDHESPGERVMAVKSLLREKMGL